MIFVWPDISVSHQASPSQSACVSTEKSAVTKKDPDQPCFTKKEVRDIIFERNELKTNLFLVQEELNYYQRWVYCVCGHVLFCIPLRTCFSSEVAHFSKWGSCVCGWTKFLFWRTLNENVGAFLQGDPEWGEVPGFPVRSRTLCHQKKEKAHQGKDAWDSCERMYQQVCHKHTTLTDHIQK